MKQLYNLMLLQLFSLISLHGHSQNLKTVDSLQTRMNVSTPWQRVDLLLAMCFEYADVDSNRALDYVDQAHSLAASLNDSQRYVRTGRVEAQLLHRKERIEEARAVLTKVLPIAQRVDLKNERKKILNLLGLIETVKGNFAVALKYNFQSLILREEDGNTSDISIALMNIGFVYFKLENYDEALFYYERALSLKLKTKDTYDLTRLLIDIGLCQTQLGNHDGAFKSIRRAFQNCRTPCADRSRMEGLLALALAHRGKGNLDSSLLLMRESLSLATQIDDKRFVLENLKSLAKTYIELSQLDSAKKILDRCDTLVNQTDYKSMILGLYQIWSDYHFRKKHFELAALYGKKYSSLYETEVTRKFFDVIRVQSEFNERENRKIIANQNQILILKGQIIENHKALILLTGLVAILFIILTIILLKRYRIKQRHNDLLDIMVRERSNYLKENMTILRRNLEEQNRMFKKSISDLKTYLMQLKGLNNVMVKDPHNKDAIDQGVLLIIQTESKILQVVNKLSSAAEISSRDSA